jgi:hypothetical protein
MRLPERERDEMAGFKCALFWCLVLGCRGDSRYAIGRVMEVLRGRGGSAVAVQGLQHAGCSSCMRRGANWEENRGLDPKKSGRGGGEAPWSLKKESRDDGGGAAACDEGGRGRAASCARARRMRTDGVRLGCGRGLPLRAGG